MNWITTAWSMIAGAMLAIAGVYLVVWLQQKESRAYLMFVLLAVSTAGIAGTELWMMHSSTITEFGTAGRWFHLPVATAIFAFVGLVYYRLDANRVWLALTVCGLRAVTLIINFLQDPNINYVEITRLDRVTLLGESISMVDGVPNPWMLVAQLGLLLLIIYVLDAATTAWRRDRDGFTLALGIAFGVLVVGGSVQATLGFWEVVQIPVFVTPFFLGVSIVMSVDLGRGILRASILDSALKSTNVELRESEQHLSLAAEAAHAGLFSVDPRTDRIWATAKTRQLLALESAGELYWKGVEKRIHADDLSRLLQLVDDTLRSGENVQTDFRIMLPDGSVRWLSVLGSWRSSGEARQGMLTGVLRDITASRDKDNETAQQKTQIAHLSRVATLSELSSSLAHEINQPLGIILSNAEAAAVLLAREPPDLDELREIVADIISADRRAAGVISRMRALLRREKPKLQETSLNDSINDALSLLNGEFLIHNVSMDVILKSDLPSVQADNILLVQVILNLITNACDAVADNPPGQRVVRISTEANGEEVQAKISDNGSGLPQNPAQVFDPFFTTKASGLGMGLAICRSIIDAHNGRIWADSDEAGETTFHLSLPIILETA